ncbi:MAG TPA: hypothetical protein VF316_13760 [Polyangiaceae bacterium]
MRAVSWVGSVAAIAMLGVTSACGGRVSGAELTDASLDDASDDGSTDGTVSDAGDAADAPTTVDLDAASCASRAISAACSDGGVKSLLWTATKNCGPKLCTHWIDVTLDPDGCPTSVHLDGPGSMTFPDLTRCVASVLSTQRWSCGDAGTVTYGLEFSACTN